MPAGDLITGDRQVELQGVLIGGTDALVAHPGVGGLGIPTPKSADVDLALADGAYGSPDYMAVRVITVPILINETTETDAMTLFAALLEAWAPVTADVPLHLQVAGLGHVVLTGRPRGLAEDLSLASEGVINCMGTFVALDPTIYAPPGIPTIGTATGGVASATVTHTVNPVGGPPTGVTITPYIAGAAQTPQTFTDTALTHVVTGLTNGTAYTFKVAATNPAGTSGQSAASNSVTPATVPGAPVIGVATAGVGSATANWAAPASDGGSTITHYVVSRYRASDNLFLGSSTIVAPFFSNAQSSPAGVGVYFKVAATNAVGTGVQSAASNTVTPS